MLYQIAGLGYLTHTFVLVLAPSLADRVFLAIMGPIFIAGIGGSRRTVRRTVPGDYLDLCRTSTVPIRRHVKI